MLNEIQDEIKDSLRVKELALKDTELLGELSTLIDTCLSALQQGGKIIFCGNGGSFADAQHLSAEFTSRFLFDRAPLPSLVLGANNSAISAIGNDYGYEYVFSRELQSIATEKDVFVGISTSGNSKNVIAAIEVAKEKNVPTWVFTGETGGKMNGMCNLLKVPSPETARIQECHIVLGHILCGQVEKRYFKG